MSVLLSLLLLLLLPHPICEAGDSSRPGRKAAGRVAQWSAASCNDEDDNNDSNSNSNNTPSSTETTSH